MKVRTIHTFEALPVEFDELDKRYCGATGKYIGGFSGTDITVLCPISPFSCGRNLQGEAMPEYDGQSRISDVKVEYRMDAPI